jgi:hypothetical protein
VYLIGLTAAFEGSLCAAGDGSDVPARLGPSSSAQVGTSAACTIDPLAFALGRLSECLLAAAQRTGLSLCKRIRDDRAVFSVLRQCAA